MPNIITIAYLVEGPTDVRFLQNIIQRTFEEVAFFCEGDIDVYSPIQIINPKLGSFNENILSAAQSAEEMGIHVLCVHTDSDNDTDDGAFEFKINPAFEAVGNSALNLCKNLVAVVPVQMCEAWMLADRDLLKDEIGTNKSNADLGIARAPETIADPKEVIENAIRISDQDKPKKSRSTTISDLYQPIGQKIPLQTLEILPSFMKFKLAVENAFRQLNYLK